MIRTKVCGITSKRDLDIAVSSGADAVGFLVGKKYSARGFISIDLAKELSIQTPLFVNTVVVTHYKEYQKIDLLLKKIKPSSIQIHSDIDIKTLKKLKENNLFTKIISKVSVQDSNSLLRARELENYSDAILLDTIDIENNKVGGTGKVHDWNISKEIVSKIKIPIILAGGLNHLNVKSAIDKVKPWAVDANTGLNTNGHKDETLVNKFIKVAKRNL